MNQIYEKKNDTWLRNFLVKLNLWPLHHLTFMCDIDFQFTDQMFQMALLHIKENKCTKWFEIHA